MEQEEPKKKYLAISSISMLGRCETKLLEALSRTRKPTMAMAAGTVEHKNLAGKLPRMTKEQIISGIKAGHRIEARELMIYDPKSRICGRIDHLQTTGLFEGGRQTSFIIDDKYPSSPERIYGITLPYKIQLAGYAVALSNSEDYGTICKVIGTQLRYRENGTHKIIRQYSMNSARLGACLANMGSAIGDAWALYERKREPKHRRLDVEEGVWTECHCEQSRWQRKG
jgi:hypothetical protein